jgi:release factor glutamine methyltransferase
VWNVRFRQGDLFDAAEPAPYDVITANPPYVTCRELTEVAPDIRDHEPHLALVGGEDGLDVVRRIVGQAASHLLAGGVLAMEIGCEQGDATRRLLEDEGFADVRVDRDLGGRPRVVSGVRPGGDADGRSLGK